MPPLSGIYNLFITLLYNELRDNYMGIKNIISNYAIKCTDL